MTEQRATVITKGRQKLFLLKPDQRGQLRRLFTVFLLGVVGMGFSGGKIGSNTDELTDKDFIIANERIAQLREAEQKKDESEADKDVSVPLTGILSDWIENFLKPGGGSSG